MADIARHVRLTGQVQGVFFRAWARDQARSLDVKGWIRNCPDGRVESHVEGDETAVEQLIERMRSGPPSARVEDLRVWEVDTFDYDDFEVRH